MADEPKDWKTQTNLNRDVSEEDGERFLRQWAARAERWAYDNYGADWKKNPKYWSIKDDIEFVNKGNIEDFRYRDLLPRTGQTYDDYKSNVYKWLGEHGLFGSTNAQQLEAFQNTFGPESGSWTDEEWAQYKEMWGIEGGPGVANAPDAKLTPEQAKAKKEKEEADAKRKSSAAILQEFAREMMSDKLDMNDPEVAQIINNTRNAAQTEARNRGLGAGGISELGMADRLNKAQLDTLDRRRQMGLQAQGMVNAQEMGYEQLDLAKKQFAEQLHMNDAAAAQAAAQASAGAGQGAGAAIGGVIGGGLGALASIPLGFGTTAPFLVPAGASLGAGVGGLIGGGGGPRPYMPRRRTGSGGLGAY